jgi:hypothetical protein
VKAALVYDEIDTLNGLQGLDQHPLLQHTLLLNRPASQHW